jgi:hypothetical protein
MRAVPITTARRALIELDAAHDAVVRSIGTERTIAVAKYTEARQRAVRLLEPPPITAPDPLRQSSIARFNNCPLSLLLDAQRPESQSGNMAARGTLFHRWVALVLREMRAEGWTEYPVEMGLEKLLQVLAQVVLEDHGDGFAEQVVHLPMNELRWLRVLATRWCEGTMRGGGFNAQRILALDEDGDRLFMPLKVPDGRGGTYERVVTGLPDVLVNDPPDGIIVVDWKTGWAKPSKSDDHVDRQGGGDDDGRLSEQGYAQQVIYGALGLFAYPAAQRFTLREAYVMWGEYREATIHRWQLERVLDVLGVIVAQMDAAFSEGPDSDRWIAKAGVHCGICPAVSHCPIKDWEGIPQNLEEAVLLAREWIVSAQVRKDRLPLLKGWVDAHGPIEIDHGKGRRVVGWPEWDGVSKARGTFKLYEPVDAPESPFDAQMEAVLRDR